MHVASTMMFVILTLIFLVGIFLILKKVQNGNQKQNLPPGPWGLPLIGHLVFLGRNPHLTLIKWKQKYGPIIRIRFGSFPVVVLSDFKLIKEAFNMSEFSGRPQLQLYHENNTEKAICGPKSLIMAVSGYKISDLSRHIKRFWDPLEGQYNTEMRQFAIRKLKEFGMGRKTLEDKIQGGISELLDFIKEKEGLPIKSENVPSAHIITTLWSIMMTDELNLEKAEHLNHLLIKISEIGPVLTELAGFMPWMEKLARMVSFGRFSFLTERANLLQEIYSFITRPMYEKNRKWVNGQGQGQGQGQVPIDIMEMYLEKVAETTDKSSPFHASQNSAMYFLTDIFAGGIHTIDTTLLWMLNYMARNPVVQKKLQEEIDQVVGNSRLPSLTDRGQMPYADAVVHELLRNSSIAALGGVPHKTTADVRFHGYTIKKGTMIFANVYGIHHDPEIWGDPENFRPERWLGESGRKLKSDHFLPFLMGRRICPGEALAREQLFLYVTTLFQSYRVDFELGELPEIKGVFAITLNPPKFTVVFSQRKTK